VQEYLTCFIGKALPETARLLCPIRSTLYCPTRAAKRVFFFFYISTLLILGTRISCMLYWLSDCKSLPETARPLCPIRSTSFVLSHSSSEQSSFFYFLLYISVSLILVQRISHATNATACTEPLPNKLPHDEKAKREHKRKESISWTWHKHGSWTLTRALYHPTPNP
jgi:hypothetical protein